LQRVPIPVFEHLSAQIGGAPPEIGLAVQGPKPG
jgi:hypothetical protein